MNRQRMSLPADRRHRQNRQDDVAPAPSAVSGCTASRPVCSTITPRLVDTVTAPMLLKTVRSKKLDPTALMTHRVSLDHILDADKTFGRAAVAGALRVIVDS